MRTLRIAALALLGAVLAGAGSARFAAAGACHDGRIGPLGVPPRGRPPFREHQSSGFRLDRRRA